MKILNRLLDILIFNSEYPDDMNEELVYAREEEEEGETYYSRSELFDLWIEYLNYYNVTFQELNSTSGLEYSFPKWLEENDKEIEK